MALMSCSRRSAAHRLSDPRGRAPRRGSRPRAGWCAARSAGGRSGSRCSTSTVSSPCPSSPVMVPSTESASSRVIERITPSRVRSAGRGTRGAGCGCDAASRRLPRRASSEPSRCERQQRSRSRNRRRGHRSYAGGPAALPAALRRCRLHRAADGLTGRFGLRLLRGCRRVRTCKRCFEPVRPVRRNRSTGVDLRKHA